MVGSSMPRTPHLARRTRNTLFERIASVRWLRVSTRWLPVLIAAVFLLQTPASLSPSRAQTSVDLPFSETSYWNTPLPARAPIARNSGEIIQYLQSVSNADFISLAGTGRTGEWGMPIYEAGDGDPVYDVANTCPTMRPPEFAQVRIPLGARADPTSDAAMTIYDRGQGLVFGLWRARYDATSDAWTACGGSVYYLGSNGLHGQLPDSDEPRNVGHRGIPPPTWAVQMAEIESRSIAHVLKIAVPATKCEHVFPMVRDECGTTAMDAPPEGTRIRIKPSIDLSRLPLSPAARVVARALKRYGAVIGDQSGRGVVLKVENTVIQGQGWLWQGILDARSLSAIPLNAYEVIQHGYRPDAPA
jgi:hypothetical protein